MPVERRARHMNLGFSYLMNEVSRKTLSSGLLAKYDTQCHSTLSLGELVLRLRAIVSRGQHDN